MQPWSDIFPILNRQVHGRRLVYLDNAATTLKPLSVISAVDQYYRDESANIHRGVHHLSELATAKFEDTRRTVAQFLGGVSPESVIFTSGTTASINLVAHSYLAAFAKAGQDIVITGMEHHANIVPWQLACKRLGLNLKAIPVLDNGELDLDVAEKLITKNTRLLSFVHTSNSLGTINPVRRLIAMARQVGAHVLVDGAQAVAHQVQNLVDEIDADFYAFSAHKLFGPTGVGVLIGKPELLEKMPPFLGGGDMIRTVSIEHSTFAPPPHRFEAGTPHIAGVIGLDAAIKVVQKIGFAQIAKLESELLARATEALKGIPGLRIIGEAAHKAAIVSFVLDSVHPHDLGSLLDEDGIAIRTGHHCCQPLMDRFAVPATARASFSFYNQPEDIDLLVRSINRAQELFA